MHGYIFLVVFSVTICSTVSQHDTQYIPNRRSTTCQENENHHHDHSHKHSHSKVEAAYSHFHSQDMTERSPRSTNSNTKPFTDSQYHNTEPLHFNITLVPYPLLNANTRKITKDGDSTMIFPDSDRTSLTTRKIISRNCTYGLCEVVDNYPVEKVNSLVSRSKELRQYFEKMEVPAQIDFNNRFGDDGESLCLTISHTVFPRSAKNTKDVELFLVNDGEFKQGVIFETCASEGKPCSYSDIFPMGYSTTCKQKYTVRRLMAVADDSDNSFFDNFPMPACCVCTVKKTV